MKLIYKEKDKCIEAVKIECTAEEYLFLVHAMRIYADNTNIHDSNRDVMKQMLEVKPIYEEVNEIDTKHFEAMLAEMDCKDCKQEVKSEPPSAISKEDLSKSFMLGLAFGYGDKHNEMDSIKKLIEQTFKPVREIRSEIEKHCGLIQEDHCKFCSSCHCLMGVREILEILDKHGGKDDKT